MSTRFCQDFEVEVQAEFEAGVWSVFCRCNFSFVILKFKLVEILKLGLVKILNFKFSGDADVWFRFFVDAQLRF